MLPIVAHSAFTIIVVLNYIQTTSKCSLLGNLLSLPIPATAAFSIGRAIYPKPDKNSIYLIISQPGPLAPPPLTNCKSSLTLA